MATAPTLPQVSVEEYLRTDYEPHCEYLDGVLVPKSVPDLIHNTLQKLLILHVGPRERHLGIWVLPELHLRITPSRFRIPDLAVLTRKPLDGRYPDKETPPLLTVEIVSKDESWGALRGKLSDHLAMGVQTVIIADPYNRTVMVADQSTPLHELAPPLVVNIAVPGSGTLQINFDELFSQLD